MVCACARAGASVRAPRSLDLEALARRQAGDFAFELLDVQRDVDDLEAALAEPCGIKR